MDFKGDRLPECTHSSPCAPAKENHRELSIIAQRGSAAQIENSKEMDLERDDGGWLSDSLVPSLGSRV